MGRRGAGRKDKTQLSVDMGFWSLKCLKSSHTNSVVFKLYLKGMLRNFFPFLVNEITGWYPRCAGFNYNWMRESYGSQGLPKRVKKCL